MTTHNTTTTTREGGKEGGPGGPGYHQRGRHETQKVRQGAQAKKKEEFQA